MPLTYNEFQLDIRRLPGVCENNRSGSISRAADLLNIAQPALSQQLANAEKCFKQKLVIRSQKRCYADNSRLGTLPSCTDANQAVRSRHGRNQSGRRATCGKVIGRAVPL
ncbi:LysR family transcriptional regulator [Komagataeibacter saccharivorans]|uniref:LysR family transcriptional regulator n=1 Tax=Komagataeibacter saccharivorans TaxID=265959 RepID=UPI003571214D